MEKRRIRKLNSLLQEVISEVIQKEVSNPLLPPFVSITRVEITEDLHLAKVFFTVIGDEKVRADALEALNRAAGFISQSSSKKVSMRFFPSLSFEYDDALDKRLRIEELLHEISDEKSVRDDM